MSFLIFIQILFLGDIFGCQVLQSIFVFHKNRNKYPNFLKKIMMFRIQFLFYLLFSQNCNHRAVGFFYRRRENATIRL